MEQFWEKIRSFFEPVVDIINTNLFHLGNTDFSLGTLLFIFGGIALVIFISRLVRTLIVTRIAKLAHAEKGMAYSVGTIVQYLLIMIGVVLIVQQVGVNLAAFGFIAGALGVGVGFGLQNLVNDFVSGLIILFERPIKIGDRIQIDGVEGDVVTIKMRSTEVRTNDNIYLIVPNSRFTSGEVINWSHNDHLVRFHFPVGVSYKEDPEKIKELLIAVAKDNPHIENKPAPDVWFSNYGDNSLDFLLVVWTTKYAQLQPVLKSELYFEIFKRFSEEGVEIPYPQRDVHIKSEAPQNVVMKKSAPEAN